MNEEVPILTLIIAAGLVLYVGYETEQRRNKLRRIFNCFDKEESKIADGLELMVRSGALKPYTPHPAV